jgi:hypothetical protein
MLEHGRACFLDSEALARPLHRVPVETNSVADLFSRRSLKMTFRNVTRVIVVLAATAALAQSTPPGTLPGGGPIASQRRGLPGAGGLAAKQNPKLRAVPSLPERVKDMEQTLAQMHVVLKRMQAKQAKSGVKDSLAKANLDMWGLMVGQLDNELQELRAALAAREDMEARRAALYRQANAKADAEAQAARAAQSAKFVGDPHTTGSGAPAAAPKSIAAPTASPSAPASNSPSPK